MKRKRVRICHHITVERSDHLGGDITYEIFGNRNIAVDCQWGELARIYTTQQDADAAAEGFRKHPELCIRCREIQRPRRKRP